MKKRFLLIAVLCIMLAAILAMTLQAAQPTLSTAVASMTEDVTVIKSGIFGKTISFCQADFKQALGVSRFEKITIVSLPDAACGALTLKGTPVRVGDEISFAAIRHLAFTPANEGTEEADFRFTAGSLAGGGEINCVLRFVKRANYAPTLLSVPEEELAAETQKGVSLWGTLRGSDPEGDDLTFRIVSYPKNGTLQLMDTENGDYRYIPKAGFTGRDSFRYVARDAYGNWSGEAEVRITVTAQVTSEVYADMSGTKAENAALHLTARSIMQGELIGDGLFFHPDETVTRGEFVVMAMKAAGISPLAGNVETCFDDNENIPAAMRPYIATAQRFAIVHGTFADGALQFRSDQPITKAEAAVVLSRILDTEEAESAPTFADSAEIPIWARSAVEALYELGIYIADGENAEATETLCRAEAAEMLYRIIELTEAN